MPTNQDRSTSDLVAAANILQELSPSKVGLLLVLYDNDTQTQKEISELIGRTQSTISTYLQSLGNLPSSLASKQGRYYTITQTGEKVIGLINNMARQCGLKLRSINWTDESDRKDVKTLLTPLTDSKIMRPYFVLDSLYIRSDIDGLIGSPSPVKFDDIVRDVETRQNDFGKSVTTEEIRRTVRRFDETNTARFEGEEVKLTNEKGHQHAWLWNQLVQYLKTEDMVASDEKEQMVITDADAGISEGDLDDSITTRSPACDESRQSNEPGRSPNQVISERSRAERQSVNQQEDDLDQPNIIPVYTLSSGDGDREHLSSSLTFPLTSKTTIENLAGSINRLADEYSEDTELVLEWMVQTESGLYPLASTDTHSSHTVELQTE